jgi:hypothetical protein
MKGPAMSVCPYTRISIPECSCIHCLERQVQLHRPSLLEADPIGEIRVTRADGARNPASRAPRKP